MSATEAFFASVRTHIDEFNEAVEEYIKLDNQWHSQDDKYQAIQEQLIQADRELASCPGDMGDAEVALVEGWAERIGHLPIEIDQVLVWSFDELAAVIAQNLRHSSLPIDVRDHLGYGAWDYQNGCEGTIYRKQFEAWVQLVGDLVMSQADELEDFHIEWEDRYDDLERGLSSWIEQKREMKRSRRDTAMQMQALLDQYGPHFRKIVSQREKEGMKDAAPEAKERQPKLSVTEAKKEAKAIVRGKVPQKPSGESQGGRVHPFLIQATRVARDNHLAYRTIVMSGGEKPAVIISGKGEHITIPQRKGWEREIARLAEKWA